MSFYNQIYFKLTNLLNRLLLPHMHNQSFLNQSIWNLNRLLLTFLQLKDFVDAMEYLPLGYITHWKCVYFCPPHFYSFSLIYSLKSLLAIYLLTV